MNIGAVGLGIAYSALAAMVPSCSDPPLPAAGQQPSGPQQTCEDPRGLSPKIGVPLALGGVGTALVGGVLLATASGQSEEQLTGIPAAPAPPDEPTVLDGTEAVGMAIAQLVLVGLDSDVKPSTLLGVDDTQVKVRSEGRRAELWNLRIRTAADETWRVVAACYEYKHDWQLVSLGTTLGCGWSRSRF